MVTRQEPECEIRITAPAARVVALVMAWAVALVSGGLPAPVRSAPIIDIDRAVRVVQGFNFESLRLAITDLSESFGAEYPRGRVYLERLAALEALAGPVHAGASDGDTMPRDGLLRLANDLEDLRREALLANPLLRFGELLLIRHDARRFRLPRNDTCYSSIPQRGYDCEITVLSPVTPAGTLTTFFKPSGGRYLADLDLHFDADKMLFTMPGDRRWQVFEIAADGSGLRQVTFSPHDDVDSFDACYLPNGSIVYCSTANYQSVPCYNGTRHVGGLYLLDADSGRVRQLTFDQDDDSYPTVMNNGRVMFTRWEYAGTPHFFTRLIFQMYPDGFGQESLYGTNSYWPNAVYQARCLPDHPTRFVGIVSGHHGDRRMGELVIFDAAQGRREVSGVVQRIGTPGRKVKPIIMDRLVDGSWPKFMHPWPLSRKYLLVACKPTPRADWGIYLADVFDNLLLIREEPGYALLEPVPLARRPVPPVLADRVDLRRKDAVVYLVDVYEGEGLQGVPRGTVKRLRLVSPHYGYFGNAGWLNIAIDGAWDVQRILGTVPVHEDGSACFRVPANTPISIQPLDAEGKAVQLMRSWFTAMPGEVRSCVGCHEDAATAAPNVRTKALAGGPGEIEPWLGPARGFSFKRDVQPVLDAYCVACHDGREEQGRRLLDLRAREFFPDYQGVVAPVPKVLSDWLVPPEVTMDHVGVETSPLSMRRQERIRFTPSYEALHPYVRRGGSESDAHMLVPYEFHADTSELVQMLRKGHHGVRLDLGAWSRLVTWIDLDVPCHGTWHEVYPIPFNGRERRLEYLNLYAGIEEDYEAIPELSPFKAPSAVAGPWSAASRPRREASEVTAPGFPFGSYEARARQAATATSCGVHVERAVELGSGAVLRLVLVPPGAFVMGDAEGSEDERPLTAARISHPFWMGTFEVRNREFALFDPSHDSGYISQLSTAVESQGYPVNDPDQPVVRVSWTQAMAFCDWLSGRTGERFSLPTEAQWEYACRAGTAGRLWYGKADLVFNAFGNMADRSLAAMARRDRDHWLYSGHPDWVLRDNRSCDDALVTTPVGHYLPNPWGLHDMHGNAAEWTRTAYLSYPYRADDGREDPAVEGRKVVRGGSWYDRPHRCTSGFRMNYHAWQRVYNVGFRVVCEIEQ